MAKTQNFIGGIRGRVGSLVYSKGGNGSTIVRTYQPQVANPQTLAQREQRAKVNLCGQLSALVAPEIIEALQMGSRLANRNDFNSRNIRNTTVQTRSDGSILASLRDRDVVFSHGSVQPLASPSALQVSASALSLTLTLRDANKAGIYGERIVAVVSKVVAERTYETVVYVDTVLTDTAAKNVTLTFPVELTENKNVAVYRLPFELSTRGRALITGEMVGNDAALTATIAAQRSAVQDWGETVYFASTVFQIG